MTASEPCAQAAQLFKDHLSQCPADEIVHSDMRQPVDCDDSDLEDPGLDSILYKGG